MNIETKLTLIVTLATGGLIFLSLMIILFVVFYQRRVYMKQTKISQLEAEGQRELLNAVLTAKENEQKRIAQELHDEIGSSVNAVKLSLNVMAIPSEEKKILSEELLQISKNVRRISNELMPSVLDELGFHQAVNHLIKKYEQSSNGIFSIDLNLNEPFPLVKAEELGLYRVLQELMNNIVKYAEASHVSLEITHTSDCIVISLKDDGNGFKPDVQSLTKGDSLGLKNIQSRIQQIRGKIDYELPEQGGTIVRIELKNYERN